MRRSQFFGLATSVVQSDMEAFLGFMFGKPLKLSFLGIFKNVYLIVRLLLGLYTTVVHRGQWEPFSPGVISSTNLTHKNCRFLT